MAVLVPVRKQNPQGMANVADENMTKLEIRYKTVHCPKWRLGTNTLWEGRGPVRRTGARVQFVCDWRSQASSTLRRWINVPSYKKEVPLYFRGYRILQAVMHHLLLSKGLAAATEVPHSTSILILRHFHSLETVVRIISPWYSSHR